MKKYVAGQTKNRNSKLSQTLKFDEIRKELKGEIIAAINIKLEPALGLHILRKNAEEKENLQKTIGLKCYTFKSFIEENGVKWDISRRVGQIDSIEKVLLHRSDTDMTKVICFNNTDLTWDKAFYNLTGEVSDYDMKLLNIGQLISDSAIVSVEAVLTAVGDVVEKKVLKSLLVCYPILFMKKISGAKFIINLHKTSNGGEEIDRLLKEEESVATITKPAQTLNTSSASKAKKKQVQN